MALRWRPISREISRVANALEAPILLRERGVVRSRHEGIEPNTSPATWYSMSCSWPPGVIDTDLHSRSVVTLPDADGFRLMPSMTQSGVALLIHVREPRRSLSDPLLFDKRPHLR
jgi:hypothetical protein